MKNFGDKVNCDSEKYREYLIKKAALVKIAVFIAMVCIGAVVSFIMPLRPTQSDYEKRVLSEFPQFNILEFVNGTYFKNIDLWYADTFPFRDQMIMCNETFDNMYGFRNNVIHGEVIVGDEIPDVDIDVDSFLQFTGPSDKFLANSGGKSEDGTVISDEDANRIGKTYNSKEYEALGKIDIDADDIGVDVEDTDGSTAAQAGETLGSIYVVGSSAYNYYVFSQNTSDDYVNMVNSLTDKLNGKATVYNMLVPTSIDITLDDATRNSITSSNQKKAILYMYSRMSSRVGKSYVFDILRSHRNEYIYFRTDHHWTADGAYYAYSAFMNQTGKSAVPLSRFEKMEFGDFKGSYFTQSNVKSLGDVPDTLTAYKPFSTNSIQFINRSNDWTAYNIITDVSGWNATSKYSTFIGGDNPLSVINNPTITDGSSCLVIKESFGNAMVPFLAESYENVYVVDYRYYEGTVSELVDQYNIDTVLFVNNVAATSTAARVEEMKNVCR